MKVVDIVQKIETENRYLEKVQKIEKRRTEKEATDKDNVLKLKTTHGKWFDRAMVNKQQKSLEERKAIKDKSKRDRLS